MRVRNVAIVFLSVVVLGVVLVPLVARDIVPPWTAGVYALLFLVVLMGWPISMFVRSLLSSPGSGIKSPKQLVQELQDWFDTTRLAPPKTPGQIVQQLRDRRLLVSTDYRATRAFQMEEVEDEGSNYFLELVNGTVLFMNGQHLYDYEPINDDPTDVQPRRFPCTQFTVHRHKTEGWVAEIVCGGTVLEPEGVTPPLSKEDFHRGLVFEDGQIISDPTYEELKKQRLEARG